MVMPSCCWTIPGFGRLIWASDFWLFWLFSLILLVPVAIEFVAPTLPADLAGQGVSGGKKLPDCLGPFASLRATCADLKKRGDDECRISVGLFTTVPFFPRLAPSPAGGRLGWGPAELVQVTHRHR